MGGWARDIKLGAMRGNVAEEVFKKPGLWPGDLVQRAVEQVEERMLPDHKPIAILASDERWFSGS